MASVIAGEWTHRRGDAGGARAVPAEIERARPAVAWSWRPEHGGRVDQVRVVSSMIVVATMMPRDQRAPRWEHAVVYLLDAHTGGEIARRVLPDPVPVAAMVVEGGITHVISTRKGEPIYWYGLMVADLVPCHRRTVAAAEGFPHDDVLDAWATPDGGLWLELETVTGSTRVRGFGFADRFGALTMTSLAQDPARTDGPPLAHDACAVEHELFVPRAGRSEGEGKFAPPGLSRLGPDGAHDAAQPGYLPWASATVTGPRSRLHALHAGGLVCAVAMAEDHAKPEQAHVEVLAVERSSGEVRWRAYDDRLAINPQLGEGARVAKRPNGEVLFQSLGPDGIPCTPLLCAGPDGRLDAIVFGARGRYVLDAALGDLVLGHRQNKDGSVELSGFGIDLEGRLLGRRAVPRWTVDLPDLGGASTVYAGAGAVVVRGARSVAAVRM